MNLLCEIRDSTIFTGTQNHDPSNFAKKETSRVVLLNNFGQVALLNVERYNYHKLPGGGIEAGESPRQALGRELLEEMGCRARVIAEIGIVVEYKNQQKRK
ncbi:MAG TPA: NUDIX domain-containing protein [Candidatus Saccharimonadales bacterium]